MSTIDEFNKAQMERLTENKQIPDFAAGDTLKVHVRVKEGNRERTQIFEGVCIARKNSGVNSSFTVRKVSYGEGVERVFSLYSPMLEAIEVARRGDVRRAKLYYLRDRRGKSARIAEKLGVVASKDDAPEAKEAAPAAAEAPKKAAAGGKK